MEKGVIVYDCRLITAEPKASHKKGVDSQKHENALNKGL
jgi:hypothetical protein